MTDQTTTLCPDERLRVYDLVDEYGAAHVNGAIREYLTGRLATADAMGANRAAMALRAQIEELGK